MEEKLLIAVVAAIAAVFGGVLTSVLAPWVKHKIERKAAEIDRKRKLISDWRQMIAEVSGKTDAPDVAQSLLQAHPNFHSLEPHLTEEARRAAYARQFVVAAGVHIPYPLHVIKNDIMRIEKEWNVAH